MLRLDVLEEASGFQVKRFIAWGDGGAVYQGAEPDTLDKVVLRVFNEDLPKGNAARIERELGRAIGINNSNVAKTYCCGWVEDRLFMVGEHVDGSLADLIGSDTVRTKRALLFLIMAVRGLLAMAQVKLHHGSLKPANLRITKDDTLKVVDMALTHASPRGSTLPEVGRYLAPEANPDDRAGLKQDMYALGAVFYHVLVGKAPNMFKRKRLSDLRKDLPTKFCAKIERLLAHKPEDRFKNYEELLKHLFRLANEYKLDVPPAVEVAKPPSPPKEKVVAEPPHQESEQKEKPEEEAAKPPRPDPFFTHQPDDLPICHKHQIEEIKPLKGSVIEDATSFLLEHFPHVVLTNCVVIGAAYALAFFITAPIVGLLTSLFKNSPIMMVAAPAVVLVVPAFLLIGKMWFCEALTSVMVARRFYEKQGGGEGSVDLCSERLGAILTGGLVQILSFWGAAAVAGFVCGLMSVMMPGITKVLALIALVCVIIYLQTIWSLTVIAAALEDKWSFDALARSTSLVKPRFWPVLGYRFFFAIIGAIGVWGFNVLAGGVVPANSKGVVFLIAMAAQVLTEAIAISLYSSGMACAYHHLEARRPAKSKQALLSRIL